MKQQLLLFFVCIFMGCALPAQPITLSTPAQESLIFKTPDGVYYLVKSQAHAADENVLHTYFFKSSTDISINKWEEYSVFTDDEAQKIYAYAYGIADTVPVLFAAANDGTIKLFDYYRGDWRFADRFKAHEGPVTNLSALDYNKNIFVVSLGADNTVALWKQTVIERELLARFELSPEKQSVRALNIFATNMMHENFTVVVTHEDGQVSSWDVSDLIKNYR